MMEHYGDRSFYNPELNIRMSAVNNVEMFANNMVRVHLNNGTIYEGRLIESNDDVVSIIPTEEQQREINVNRMAGNTGNAGYGRVTLNNQVVGIATDVNFTVDEGDFVTEGMFDINNVGAPVLRGTSDTYRIYYQEFDKEKQKYGGTKYTGYDHWLDFLEGIRKHKNKSHKIVNLYSNKHHVTDDKKERLLKLI